MTNYRLSQRKRSRKSVVEFLFHKNIDRAKRQFPRKNKKKNSKFGVFILFLTLCLPQDRRNGQVLCGLIAAEVIKNIDGPSP